METDWKDDRILWLGGDETDCVDPDDRSPVIHHLQAAATKNRYAGDLLDFQLEICRNIAKQFSKSKDTLMDAYRICEEFGDTEAPQGYGLSLRGSEPRNLVRKGMWFRYTLDQTKHEYIDQEESSDDGDDHGYSGFPALMAYGQTAVGQTCIGRWIGDTLILSDEAPNEGYQLLHAKDLW